MWSKARAARVLALSLAAYVVLVATNEGEFWPASIYPMFSVAGRPWTRALVRDVATVPAAARWRVTDLGGLPGRPVVLPEIGIDPIDFANFLSKTRIWDEDRVTGLRSLFTEDLLRTRQLMVYKVRGHLAAGDSVVVEATPFLLLTGQETARNPELPPEAYARDR